MSAPPVGTHVLKAVAWDAYGNSTTSAEITVMTPAADALPRTIYVDASGSTADAGIGTYTWDWGDGTMPDRMTSPLTSHTYGVPRGTTPAPAPPTNGTGPPPTPYTIFGYTYDQNGNITRSAVSYGAGPDGIPFTADDPPRQDPNGIGIGGIPSGVYYYTATYDANNRLVATTDALIAGST